MLRFTFKNRRRGFLVVIKVKTKETFRMMMADQHITEFKKLVEWDEDDESNTMEKICGFSLFCGNMTTINFLQSQECCSSTVFHKDSVPLSILIGIVASKSDELFELFKEFLIEVKDKADEHTLTMYAPNVKRLQWMHSNGFSIDEDNFSCAVDEDNIPIIKWLLINKFPLFTEHIFTNIANKCNLEMMKYIYSRLSSAQIEKWDIQKSIFWTTTNETTKPCVDWLMEKLKEKKMQTQPVAVRRVDSSSDGSCSDDEEDDDGSSTVSEIVVANVKDLCLKKKKAEELQTVLSKLVHILAKEKGDD